MEEFERNYDEPEMSEEEFDAIVVMPIRGAYRIKDFLLEMTESNSREVWYEALKHTNHFELKRNVERWITENTKLPVLADICNGIDLYARMNRGNDNG